ncbi:PR domain zinc finger protein 1 [Aplysia californica]|uniref:PR domain zinc finger protein 1 n=1 Tax=Aplysia californica TaxID=6500 RepID=A0ABM1VRT9_APLCA|nr:PR domain zinc finger protein 1 [Aplysia californica]
MGVVTVTDIDYGQIFGPFPSDVTSTDPVYVIGMLTSDKHPGGMVIRVDTNERRDGQRPLDWLSYVSPARDEEEQNMEAYLKDGAVYYRTLRIVKSGEELLVWYSKDFSQILGVPELQTNCKRDDEQFICSHCGEMFDFPYPLRAHLKYKCSFTIDNNPHSKLPIQLPAPQNLIVNPNSFSMEESTENSQPPNLSYRTNNNTMFKISSKRQHSDSIDAEFDSKAKRVKTEDNFSRVKKSSAISHSIEELSKSYVSKSPEQTTRENGLDTHTANVSAFRKVERSHSPEAMDHRLGSPNSCLPGLKPVNHCLRTPSPGPTVASSPTSSTTPGPHTLPVHESRQSSPNARLSASPSDEPSTSSMPPPPPRAPIKSMTSGLPTSRADYPMANASIMGLYMPRLPMLPASAPLGIPGGSMMRAGSSLGGGVRLPHSAFSDQIPAGLLEMCRATIPTVGPLTESFVANIRNSNVHETLAKQALFADRHISSLGFLKSTNPMVEKLLQSTNPTLLSSPINALNLSQNWCAKCNATFRMTSDLVYHMRSHHKREFDPMKRKREEKLKCNICNEAFRERHHLTRHMSSHA